MKRSGGNSEPSENQGREKDGRVGIIKQKKNDKNKMKKNMHRLGGRGGLSLEAFANAKTRNDKYNPAFIKKQQEFYRNAKYLSKFKRSLKREEQQNVAERPVEGDDATTEGNFVNKQNKRNRKKKPSLTELYEMKREENEKARKEREAMIQAKKEEREQSEARRRSLKEKMYKKTKLGQPVMKYRIEHLLETIQGSSS